MVNDDSLHLGISLYKEMCSILMFASLHYGLGVDAVSLEFKRYNISPTAAKQ